MLPFEQNIIPTTPNVISRFEKPAEVSSKIFSVNSQFEKKVWAELETKSIIKPFELCGDKFKVFEVIDFSGDHKLVSARLSTINPPTKNFLLIWNSSFNALVTDFDTVIHHWDDFFCPSSDDLYIISQDKNLILYFAHFECLNIGQYLTDNKLYM